MVAARHYARLISMEAEGKWPDRCPCRCGCGPRRGRADGGGPPAKQRIPGITVSHLGGLAAGRTGCAR